MKLIRQIVFVFLGFQSAWSQEMGGKPQEGLPKSILKLGNKTLRVEIARTPETQKIGLMYRRELNQDAGMLLVFPTERTQEFWMKNTYIPLSIGYFDSKRRLIHWLDMQPHLSDSSSPSKTYPSAQPAKYALEVNQGWFEMNQIKPGMKFTLSPSNKGLAPK